jgi:predicted RNA-binding protein associated with RNAse of E/G family
VRKLRPDGSQVFAWEGEVLRCDASGIVLRAPFNVDVVERGYTTFRRGDVFVEFYYWDRAYNVFQISTPAGELKGWYCNLGLPPTLAEELGELAYVDLALDLWANPDGSFLVLDEDELEALLAQHPEVTAAALSGRAELIRLAESRQLPTWPETT